MQCEGLCMSIHIRFLCRHRPWLSYVLPELSTQQDKIWYVTHGQQIQVQGNLIVLPCKLYILGILLYFTQWWSLVFLMLLFTFWWDIWSSPGGSAGKESAYQCRSLGFYPWVGKIPWRRKWQPTPVSLPGKFHGQRTLVGHILWGNKEFDTTEHAHSHTHRYCI